MSQNMENSRTTTTDHRQFDWGPPTNNSTDNAKEWLVYFAVLLLLGGGVWILLDINGNGKGKSTTTPQAKTVTNQSAPTDSTTIAESSRMPTKAIVASNFFVQLGAFADAESAREVYEQMTQEGFSPTLAEPDHQYEIFRIFVGPFVSEAEADLKAQQLNELGFTCFVSESL